MKGCTQDGYLVTSDVGKGNSEAWEEMIDVLKCLCIVSWMETISHCYFSNFHILMF